jgi:hypothetical protein
MGRRAKPNRESFEIFFFLKKKKKHTILNAKCLTVFLKIMF